MKQIFILIFIICSLVFSSCNGVSKRKIGNSDEKINTVMSDNDVNKYFVEHYVNERKLPMLDIDIENPFISDDRTLVLNDSIGNNLELMMYEYYHSLTSGSYEKAKDMISDGSLMAATEAYEKNFKEGIYYSKIIIDDIELIDKDDLEEISYKNKETIVKLLSDLNIEEFAIVKVEKTINHNEKSLGMVPQVGNGEVERYFLLGKKDGSYKIIEVYWEGFMDD